MLFAGALLRGELLRGELLLDPLLELILGEFFFGALLLREILSPAVLAGRVFVECRTFIRLKSSTITDGTRAEPVPIRQSVAIHMGFTARKHASGSVNLPDIGTRPTLRHHRGVVKDNIVAAMERCISSRKGVRSHTNKPAARYATEHLSSNVSCLRAFLPTGAALSLRHR